MRRTFAALLLAAFLAPPASARPMQVVDPQGDAKTAQAGHDVVSLTFDVLRVVRTSRVRGRVVRQSVPVALTATLRLAGPRDTTNGVTYHVVAFTPCGTTEMTMDGTAATYTAGVCAPDGSHTSVSVRPTVVDTGRTLTWSVPYGTFHLPASGDFYGMYAAVGVADPRTGHALAAFGADHQQRDALAFDYAFTDQRWRYA